MTLLVKDANTTTQSISTQTDVSGNLVPVHAPAAIAGGVATPVGPTAPLPVINAAGSAAIDGSGTVVTGGMAQPLFAGVVPVNGFLVANNSSATLYVSDVGAASAGGGRSRSRRAQCSSRRPVISRRALSASMPVRPANPLRLGDGDVSAGISVCAGSGHHDTDGLRRCSRHLVRHDDRHIIC